VRVESLESLMREKGNPWKLSASSSVKEAFESLFRALLTIVHVVQSLHVAFGESNALSHHFQEAAVSRRDCLSLVLREGVRLVVHDAVQIIICVIVAVILWIHLPELISVLTFDVVPVDLHVLVSFSMIVHVREAHGVDQFIHDCRNYKASIRLQRNVLLAALSAETRVATIAVVERNVILLVGSRNEANASIFLKLESRLQDAAQLVLC